LKNPENKNFTKKIYNEASSAIITIECLNDDSTLQGVGTGFIIDTNNFILTAWHVVKEAKKIWVYEKDRDSPWEANLRGHDDLLDIALLEPKTQFKNKAFLVLGDSDKLERGDLVWAMGSPLMLKNTITQGRIINKDVSTKSMTCLKAILSDAIFNTGSSGGPLLNAKNEVVGINTQVIGSENKDGKYAVYNMYISVPINSVKKVLSRLNFKGKIKHFDIGALLINTWEYSDTEYEKLKIKRPKHNGPMILEINSGSCAENAGLLLGDVIKFVGKVEVKNYLEVFETLQLEYEVGDEVQITIIREDEYIIKILK